MKNWLVRVSVVCIRGRRDEGWERIGVVQGSWRGIYRFISAGDALGRSSSTS